MSEQPIPLDTMSFEDALKELETIVCELESGDVALDKAISAYEKGSRLKDHCYDKLNQAKARVEKIDIDNSGMATTSPLDS